MRDVYIGFAGLYPDNHRVHRAIAALNVGDALLYRQEGKRKLLLDGNGDRVGQLAKGFASPPNTTCIAARVAAITVSQKTHTEPEYRDSLRCERWEVVVTELTLEPTA